MSENDTKPRKNAKRRKVNATGTVRRRSARSLTEDQKATIRKMLREGKPQREIARTAKCSQDSVRRVKRDEEAAAEDLGPAALQLRLVAAQNDGEPPEIKYADADTLEAAAARAVMTDLTVFAPAVERLAREKDTGPRDLVMLRQSNLESAKAYREMARDARAADTSDDPLHAPALQTVVGVLRFDDEGTQPQDNDDAGDDGASQTA